MSNSTRAVAFGLFVNKVISDMREHRGMTIADIVTATGVSKTTIHRWLNGDWVTEPRANQVWDFCTGLGIPPDAAGRLLGWTSEPLSAYDGPLRQIQQGLGDPEVADDRKRAVRDLLRVAADLLGTKIGSTEIVS